MKILGLEAVTEAVGECIGSRFFLAGIGTVAGILLLSRLLKQNRPILVGVSKEVIAFKDWLGTSMAEGQEFWQDVTAEAKHLYKLDVEKKLEILQKQQEVLQRIKASL
ncbi:MAG TPA: hypothetical protein VLB01_07060 [Thermodesulfobacteriota bacterium]|nr:hypothetical protein [Thermodesulfobacteriota bacterium]